MFDMKIMTQNEFEEYIEQKSKEGLLKDLNHLFEKVPVVRHYYSTLIQPSTEITILKKYKKVIKEQFEIERGSGYVAPNVSVIDKAVSEFSQIAQDQNNVVNIIFYAIEEAIEFINHYGDINHEFYDWLPTTYESAIKISFRENLEKSIQSRCEKIKDRALHIGYGLGDNFDYFYSKNFH